MLYQILPAIILGVAAGTFTGLTPGIHINTVIPLIFFLSLGGDFSVVFITSMALTHTFLDTIPSIFLGAPNADSALGVLPGHRFLMRGKGIEAYDLTLIGSYISLLISIALLPLAVIVIRAFFLFIRRATPFALIIILLINLYIEKKKVIALIAVMNAGVIGMIALNSSISNAMMPLLSGLFGIPTIAYSLLSKSRVRTQIIECGIRNFREVFKNSLVGQIAGMFTAVLPGVGASTAAFIASLLNKRGDHGFLVMQGAVTTSNFAVSIATLYAIRKTRNGAVLAISRIAEIDSRLVLLMVLTMLIASGIAVVIGIMSSRFIAKRISRMDYPLASAIVIFIIVLLSLLLSGARGIILLIASSATGMIAPLTRIKRTHLMSSIIIPVLFFYLGVG